MIGAPRPGTGLTALVSSFWSYTQLWYEREKAKAAEWNAESRKAQLESVKDAARAADQIRTAPVPTCDTPSDWNTGTTGGHGLKTMAFLFVLVLLNSGCIVRTVYVQSKRPYLTRPERPPIPKEPEQWTPREVLLKDYALTMEARIDEYNKIARQKNIENGYEDPSPPAAPERRDGQ